MIGTRDRVLLERLTFFSDAVFAIAITLLVIEVRLPHLDPGELSERDLAGALINLLPSYIAFLSSFFVIGRFWVAHHALFGMLKASDSRLVWTNLFLLAGIAFMPFPTAVFADYVGWRVGVGVYTGWLTLLGLLNSRLTVVALRPSLVADDVPAEAVRARRRAGWTAVVIGAAGFTAGMIHPLLSLPALALATPVATRLLRGRG